MAGERIEAIRPAGGAQSGCGDVKIDTESME